MTVIGWRWIISAENKPDIPERKEKAKERKRPAAGIRRGVLVRKRGKKTVSTKEVLFRQHLPKTEDFERVIMIWRREVKNGNYF